MKTYIHSEAEYSTLSMAFHATIFKTIATDFFFAHAQFRNVY